MARFLRRNAFENHARVLGDFLGAFEYAIVARVVGQLQVVVRRFGHALFEQNAALQLRDVHVGATEGDDVELLPQFGSHEELGSHGALAEKKMCGYHCHVRLWRRRRNPKRERNLRSSGTSLHISVKYY
eukprot:545024-Prorocentrum_lima.AAC.1